MSNSVLVLDDDQSIRELISELLNPMDDIRSVATAASFAEAYGKLTNQSFDIIISDYDLSAPENGIDFIKEVREMDKKKRHNTRILLVSGSVDKDIVTQARHLKIKDIIVKPFTLDKFRNLFNQ